MTVNSINTKKLTFWTPKVHPRVCWVVCIILQLQQTAIENARIDSIDNIDTIDIIDCINQYKYNRYNWSNQLTLYTSSTQLYHYYSLFRFAWLVKVRSIVVLHTVPSCWYAHLFFLLCSCFPLNLTVVPTLKLILIYQQGMAYCCVYHGQLFLPEFLLLTEPPFLSQDISTETRRIWKSCQFSLKMRIIKSVMLSFRFGGVIRLIGGEQRGTKSSGTVNSAEVSIIYVTLQKHWCIWPDQLATSLPNAEVGFFLSTNVSPKH